MNEYIDKIRTLQLKEESQDYFKLVACLDVLEHSDSINQAFLDQLHIKEEKEVLINIYGLLQNLFVSIDALYDLTRITMDHKFAINVNQNKNLRTLKYIRNDIVGHPTHRTYETGGVGFSMFDLKNTNMQQLAYETHFFKGHAHEVNKRTLNLVELIADFKQESEPIVHDVYMKEKVEKEKPVLSLLAKQLLDNILLDQLDYPLLVKLENTYLEMVKESHNTHHRLLWRISLLKQLDKWVEIDPDKIEFIAFLKALQAMKIYQICAILEGITPTDVDLKNPRLLQSFYRFIKVDETRVTLLKNIKDSDHPYYKRDLLELLNISKNNPPVRKLLSWLDRETNEERIYLIGSALERYKIKNVHS